MALAVVAAVAAGLVLLPSSPREGGAAPAFAAPLVHFAKASPLLLLGHAPWHVVYADEESGGFGEMHWVRGPADAAGDPRDGSVVRPRSIRGRYASLTWGPATAGARRAIEGGHVNLPTGFGIVVHHLVQEARGPGWLDVSAQMIAGGRVLEFRATVTGMAMFAAELEALRSVGPTTWLRAMPPSVVRTADSGGAVRRMLAGIPLPPGFDAARIRGAELVHDRYQLGAAVTGTIACMWIADWARARATGNATMVRRSIRAMATAPGWPILREMARQGAWPEILIDYGRAMPSGRWYGRPLTGDVDRGLGCSASWGVRLPGARPPAGLRRIG